MMFAKAAEAVAGFPQLVGTPATYNGASSTSHDVTLPGGIVAGEMLLMILRQGGSNVDIFDPSGWTSVPGTVTGPLRAFYKIASGAEGSTITTTIETARKALAWTARITPATSIEGLTANATNPGALTPAGGAADFLWVAAASVSQNDAVFAFTGSPTGFTQRTYLETSDAAGAGNTDDAQLILATKEENVATQDPSEFTSTGTQNLRRALTIAIKP